ncbi:hypothetical protein BGW80DRAFT_1270200 [Lactifluus volemus]|nr:hypothetical protein BGW80DRAFT_1270200 [Lactifluus volemus]
MSLSLPAVRANQYSAIVSSPGAGSTVSRSYKWDDEQQSVTTVLTADSSATTVVIINVPATPTPTAVERVSPPVITVTSVVDLVSSSLAQEVATSSVPVTVLSSSPPPDIDTGVLASRSKASQISTSLESESAQAESTGATHTALAGAARRSSGPSGGVIAAIVIILLLAFIGAVILLFRSSQIQKRVKNRSTWTAGLGSHFGAASSLEKGAPTFTIGSTGLPPVVRDTGRVDQVPTQTIARKPPPLPYSPLSPLAPPPPIDKLPHSPGPTAQLPTNLTVTSGDTPVIVRVSFVPQLPDELPITPGEMLYIQTEFDDGWALCINSSGMRGMVPLECLEGGGGQFTGFAPARNSRRASSRYSVATWS